MNKAMNTLPKTVEKKVPQELECRKLLSPRIIEGDLDEALTDSDDEEKQDPNNENSTKHMKLNMNLPKTGKKKTNRHSSFHQQGGRKPKVRNFIPLWMLKTSRLAAMMISHQPLPH